MTSGLGLPAEMVWIFFFSFQLLPFPLTGLGDPGRKEEGPLTKLRCDVHGPWVDWNFRGEESPQAFFKLVYNNLTTTSSLPITQL